MRSRLLQLSLAGILSAALFSSPAFAQGNSQGHGKGKGHDQTVSVSPCFQAWGKRTTCDTVSR